jgi:hypothetical protein
MQVELIEIEPHVKEIVINNKSVGEFIRDVDGYFYYWPNPSLKGSWNSNALKLIADELDNINKDYETIQTHIQRED